MITDSVPMHTAFLAEPYATAKAIASRDQNNLYLTSCFFRDLERYRAFCAYYALMRVVDDRVDDLPHRSGLSDQDRTLEHEVLSAWETGVVECFNGRPPARSTVEKCDYPEAATLFEAFTQSLRTFPAPLELWVDFFRSMHWDLDHDRFETWRDFLTYAKGASVAPTTIYLVLLASDPLPSPGSFSLPSGFDLRTCGRQLGRFAYLGHIVRDLAEDLRTGEQGLLYISREDMAAHGVTESVLRGDSDRAHASVATRNLVADLLGRARDNLRKGRASMAPLDGHIGDDRTFILELIVTMYERVIDKIADCGFDPLAGRHRLTRTDKLAIVKEVAERVRFDLSAASVPPDGA
jgi:phytoene/squalene synthetase